MTMTGRLPRWRVGVAVVGTLAFSACGDDGNGSSDSSAAEFQERTVAACSEFLGGLMIEVIEVMDPTTLEPQPEEEDELARLMLERADAFLTELRSIGAPEGRVDEWREWVGLMEEAVDELRDEPGAAFGEDQRNPERSERIDELSRTLGVPECSGDDPPQIPDTPEAADTLATFLAEVIRSQSGGLIDQDEADCIGRGLTDQFTVNEMIAFQDSDFEGLPAEQRAEFLEMLIACVPAEKLEQLGQLD